MLALTGTMLDEEAPRARLAVLLKHFSELGDDREPCSRRWKAGGM